jgi:hypothetical protein
LVDDLVYRGPDDLDVEAYLVRPAVVGGGGGDPAEAEGGRGDQAATT